MGKLLTIAFSDVSEKVDLMRENNKTYKSECNGMVFSIINKEIKLGLTALNGENNKKITKQPEYA